MLDDSISVAIIGAGFSGTIVAAHLLRSATIPMRIVLIDRAGDFARGVAFGTRCSHHLLNVPAGRMSAFASDEDDFLRFAKGRDLSVMGGSFVARREAVTVPELRVHAARVAARAAAGASAAVAALR